MKRDFLMALALVVAVMVTTLAMPASPSHSSAAPDRGTVSRVSAAIGNLA